MRAQQMQYIKESRKNSVGFLNIIDINKIQVNL